jgi:hypothetical protein
MCSCNRQYMGFGVENTEEMHIRIYLLNQFYAITDTIYCFVAVCWAVSWFCAAFIYISMESPRNHRQRLRQDQWTRSSRCGLCEVQRVKIQHLVLDMAGLTVGVSSGQLGESILEDWLKPYLHSGFLAIKKWCMTDLCRPTIAMICAYHSRLSGLGLNKLQLAIVPSTYVPF